MLYLLVILIISGTSCTKVEQIIASVGQSFSFDCKLDDSVFYARRLDDWSEIQENDNNYVSLKLNFNYLTKENILRVTSNYVQAENHGYYGCRKATWATAAMNRIYQLILADVQSFYWTYTCHAPTGSCIRTDDPNDDTLSTFEVADQTNVDLYCCASVIGYKNININMNQIGDIRRPINVHKKQELDGSWVVCANQHTSIKRIYSRNEETLTCELTTDGKVSSTLSSVIVVKGAMPEDPDIDLPNGHIPPIKGDENDYFQRTSAANGRRKLKTAKRILIILGCILSLLILFGLLSILIFFLCRKRKASTNSKTITSNEYSTVRTNESNLYRNQNPNEDDSGYLQPTPLYQNVPISLRL
ncbi:hypothetical protein I4U23_014243 [Adineta vaga]|nr:hypothetical protein I4U23_014243 [Adineta vaga]